MQYSYLCHIGRGTQLLLLSESEWHFEHNICFSKINRRSNSWHIADLRNSLISSLTLKVAILNKKKFQIKMFFKKYVYTKSYYIKNNKLLHRAASKFIDFGMQITNFNFATSYKNYQIWIVLVRPIYTQCVAHIFSRCSWRSKSMSKILRISYKILFFFIVHCLIDNPYHKLGVLRSIRF